MEHTTGNEALDRIAKELAASILQTIRQEVCGTLSASPGAAIEERLMKFAGEILRAAKTGSTEGKSGG